MTSRHLIVYADDDLDDVEFVRTSFGKHDHIQLLHAPDGYGAIDILSHLNEQGLQPCLVILDINMPRMDGRATLERIRSTPGMSHLPIVLFSTSSSSNDREFARRWGSELITKPLSTRDLAHIATLFLEKCDFELE